MNSFAEFRKTVADMSSIFPMDLSVYSKPVKLSADLGERMSKVAIGAVEKNIEISTEWSRDALAGLRNVAQAKEDPSDYARVFNGFIADSAESASKHLAALAEVGKTAHKDSIEIFIEAGKESQKEAAEHFEKATDEAVNTAAKAAKSTK